MKVRGIKVTRAEFEKEGEKNVCIRKDGRY
jgi:hypothetical protein